MELYSPQYHIDKVPKDMKVLMTHGEEDSPPFKTQGNEYYKVSNSIAPALPISERAGKTYIISHAGMIPTS